MTREQLIERAEILEQTARAMRAYADDPSVEIEFCLPLYTRDNPNWHSPWAKVLPAWGWGCHYRIANEQMKLGEEVFDNESVSPE